MQKSDFPLISVCVITYNHERFINDCLQGIFSQDYPNIEVIISNDASKDSTHKTIELALKNFINHNSVRVKYFNQDNNLGICPNLEYAFKQCTGKYIAICEGDDYWISSNKLTKQVQALEDTEYVGSFHDVKYKRYGKVFESFINDFSEMLPREWDIVTLKELMNSRWLIPTCSILFKRDSLVLPDFFGELKFGDFPLFCSLATKGDLILVQGIDAVYRMDNLGSEINSIDPLGNVIKNLDFIRILNWLKKDHNLSEIDKRIQFHLTKSKEGIVSFQKSSIYNVVLRMQGLVSKLLRKWK